MSDIKIPDISEFQLAVDHQLLVDGLRAAYGAAIVVARLNYGNVKVDAYADTNIDGLRAAGADALGWYCYLIGSDDPVADANVFGRVLLAHGGLRPGEFVVCDDEEGSGDQAPRVNAFLDRVDAVLREAAEQDMWYSGLNFALAHNLEAARGGRWIAAYGAPEPTAPHDLWQFTNAMAFPGIAGPCDASLFHGTLADFETLIGGDMALTPAQDGLLQELDPTTTGFAGTILNGNSKWQEAVDSKLDDLKAAIVAKQTIDPTGLAAGVAAALATHPITTTLSDSERDAVAAHVATALGAKLSG